MKLHGYSTDLSWTEAPFEKQKDRKCLEQSQNYLYTITFHNCFSRGVYSKADMVEGKKPFIQIFLYISQSWIKTFTSKSGLWSLSYTPIIRTWILYHRTQSHEFHTLKSLEPTNISAWEDTEDFLNNMHHKDDSPRSLAEEFWKINMWEL